jgi:hypothetical protein
MTTQFTICVGTSAYSAYRKNLVSTPAHSETCEGTSLGRSLRSLVHYRRTAGVDVRTTAWIILPTLPGSTALFRIKGCLRAGATTYIPGRHGRYSLAASANYRSCATDSRMRLPGGGGSVECSSSPANRGSVKLVWLTN